MKEKVGRTHDRQGKKVLLSVVAPAFNEATNLVSLVKRTSTALSNLNLSFEIILVNDGSRDETARIIEELESADDYCVRGLTNPTNLGIFESWKYGLEASHGQFVCLIDSDLQNPPEAIPAMWRRLLKSNSHLVQGVRSSIGRDRDGRYVASRGLNWLLNKLFRDTARDHKSGFILGKKFVVKEILGFSNNSFRYPHTFIRASAVSLGYSIEEVETLFLPRRTGKSFLATKSSVRVYADVLVDCLRALGIFRKNRSPAPSMAWKMLRPPVQPRARTVIERSISSIYFATMPLHAWIIRSSTRRHYDYLRATQWLTSEQIRKIQQTRLEKLLTHVRLTVPYYSEILQDLAPATSDISAEELLSKMPLLSKDVVRSRLHFDLFSDLHDKKTMKRISTSGSTGEPFVTYADRHQLEMRFASTLRGLEMTGWRFGRSQLRLWHQTLGMTRTQAVKEKIDAFLARRTFIPAFELTENDLKKFTEKIDRKRPFLIDGYAESLNFLANIIESGAGPKHSPSAIVSSAQTLTQQTRDTIEKAFGCKVFDKYGSREFSGIAYECEKGGRHINDESYIVEIIRDNRSARPGEVGEVVITDLNNFSVPLIRYRVGDLATAVDNSAPCNCGRGLSRIGPIQGRAQALVHCSNGRWLPGTFFAHFFKEYDEMVKHFQVVQTVKGEFSLRILRNDQWSLTGWEGLLRSLRHFIDDTVVHVDFVDSIPLLATGKRTPVISELNIDFQTLRN